MKYGDVVLYEGQNYINLGIIRNNERIGDTSYDRTYRLFPISENVEKFKGEYLQIIDARIKGISMPFKKSDWIPYNVTEHYEKITRNNEPISENTRYLFERKQPVLRYE